jgi:sodium-coupled neutral amino acid transporter 11
MTLPPILLIVAIRGIYYYPDHQRSYQFVGEDVFPAIGIMAFAMSSVPVS